MATQRLERRGSAADHQAFTGAEGEITYDTNLKIERSHDGSQVGGFLQHKAGQPTSIGGDTTLSLSDFGGFIDVDTDTSSGSVTVTLPATGDMPAGWEVLIRKGAEDNELTIATNAETINGESSLVLLGVGEYAVIRFDGSNFLAFGTVSGPLAAETLSSLQTLPAGVYGSIYMLGRTTAGDGGEGHFRWDSSNLSTEVGNDEVTANEGDGGIYVAPASDKTGASGAWVRQDVDGVANLAWYGLRGDTTKDAAAIFNSAKTAISTGRIVFPPSTTAYAFDSHISIPRDIQVIAYGAEFDFGNSPKDGSAAIVLAPKANSGPNMGTLLYGAAITPGTPSDTDTYIADIHGIEFSTRDVGVWDIDLKWFDRQITSADGAFDNWFKGIATHGQYSIYWDGVTVSNQGPSVSFWSSLFAEANHIINARNVSLEFQSCNFGEPDTDFVERNDGDGAGSHNHGIKFSQCHFETTSSRTPTTTPRFKNGKGNYTTMIFDGCEFLDDNAAELFDNDGVVILDKCGMNINAENYMHTGTGIIVNKSPVIANRAIPKFLSRANSGLRNNGFETGDLTGWTDVAASGNWSVKTDRAYKGSNSVEGTSTGSGEELESDEFMVTPDAQRIVAGAWRFADDGVGAVLRLTFYTDDGTQISVTDTSAKGGSDTGWTKQRFFSDIPVGTTKVTMSLRVESSGSVDFDEPHIEIL